MNLQAIFETWNMFWTSFENGNIFLKTKNILVCEQNLKRRTLFQNKWTHFKKYTKHILQVQEIYLLIDNFYNTQIFKDYFYYWNYNLHTIYKFLKNKQVQNGSPDHSPFLFHERFRFCTLILVILNSCLQMCGAVCVTCIVLALGRGSRSGS